MVTQPSEVDEKDIVETPMDAPVTTPDELIVATVGTELDHNPPPGVAFDKVVEKPLHTLGVPVIGASAFTVTVFIEAQPVPPEVA